MQIKTAGELEEFCVNVVRESPHTGPNGVSKRSRAKHILDELVKAKFFGPSSCSSKDIARLTRALRDCVVDGRLLHPMKGVYELPQQSTQ